uniref:Uncharacterized protein n=1 Tax=Panagrolaimus sp. ES5 TaxID=591445 RepID=A0AC34FTR9_9BILA
MNQLPLLLFRHETYLGVVANAITISPSVGRFSLRKDDDDFEEVEFVKGEFNRSEDATGKVVVDDDEGVDGDVGDGIEGDEKKLDSKLLFVLLLKLR